jgi:hypothetical protein
MNMAIVNFASGGWYPRGQSRLAASVKQYVGCPFVAVTSEASVGSPDHFQVPYAFKVYSIQHAINLGYDLIFYLDSSVYIVGSIGSVVDLIKNQGHYFEEAGHYIGKWSTDLALSNFGITRDEAMKMPMVTAGCIGLDMTNQRTKKCFDRWMVAAKDGSFVGCWKNDHNQVSNDPRCEGHRHDMTSLSIICNQMQMEITRGGTFSSYVGKVFGPPSETSVFHLCPPGN